MFKKMRQRKKASKTEVAVYGAPPVPANLVEQLAAQFISSTALSTVQADIHTLVRRADEQGKNMAALNTALGEFRDNFIVPLREELKHLRYNTGARIAQTTGELDAVVVHLDRLLEAQLRTAGWSEERIKQYRETSGLVVRDTPRAAEFEEYRAAVELMRTAQGELAAQNQRLLDELAAAREEIKTLRGPGHDRRVS